jgi:hypothetical protein
MELDRSDASFLGWDPNEGTGGLFLGSKKESDCFFVFAICQLSGADKLT